MRNLSKHKGPDLEDLERGLGSFFSGSWRDGLIEFVDALGNEPSGDIRDGSRRRGRTGRAVGEVRATEFGTACDGYGAEILVAYEVEVVTVHNGSGFSALAINSVAGGAGLSKGGFTRGDIAERGGVGRERCGGEFRGIFPSNKAFDDSVNLFVGERTSVLLGEGWHIVAGDAVCNDIAEFFLGDDSKVEGIFERDRAGDGFSVTMAGDAVLGVKLRETRDIGWGFPFIRKRGFSWRLTGNEDKEWN